ncbi:MAG: ATP-dependent helicase [Verrucomicrobia subdivision 3 bacterium]|nr:ATP-dependent helicase [Limisphaerales bacterium]
MATLNLNDEFRRLNEEQKQAVLLDENTVVLAGPGSGKTATLVIKIGHLVSEKISAPSGLACITFNNDAVREFRNRLGQLGIHAHQGLFLGTVHSFCLNCVVRPYASLVDPRFRDGIAVAGEDRANELLDEAARTVIANPDIRWMGSRLTRLRRAIACGENTSGFEDTDPQIVTAYENLLLREGLIDFEGIIITALNLITEHAWVRRFLAARFPWLIVDEYQDLGGPLHRIVTSLIDHAGIRAFAVGDPDQTIYDFTGANPQYLDELASRSDFTPIRLKFNYRSGQRIIDASQAALAPTEPRGYVPDPKRQTQGEVFFLKSDGHISDHAAKTADAVAAARQTGTPWEEIAIFYRAAGGLVDAIKVELERKQIPFIWERDATFPTAPLVRWLQATAAWSLSAPEDREQSFDELFRFFSDLLQTTGRMERGSSSLDSRILFHKFLTHPVQENSTVRDYVAQAETFLGLKHLLAGSHEYATDLERYERLTELAAVEGNLSAARLREFSAYGKVRGKVVLTTLHGCKGRQFDVVIIPGCAEGMLPGWIWNRAQRTWEPPLERPLAEARRLFYVGLTRARHKIYLAYSTAFENRFGALVQLGISRFAKEISDKLKAV